MSGGVREYLSGCLAFVVRESANLGIQRPGIQGPFDLCFGVRALASLGITLCIWERGLITLALASIIT